MNYTAMLESGIGNEDVAVIFDLHPEFHVNIDGDRIEFADETGAAFYSGTGTAEHCLTETGTYARTVVNGVVIHLWASYHIAEVVAQEKAAIAKREAEAEARRLAREKEKDELTEKILKKLDEGLDYADCGEDVSAGHINILEATWYSDDHENGFRPYWSCYFENLNTGRPHFVHSWSELRAYIRNSL